MRSLFGTGFRLGFDNCFGRTAFVLGQECEGGT